MKKPASDTDFKGYKANSSRSSNTTKKLIMLRKIYLIEIAILYDTDSNIIRSDLNKLVEDIDKLSNCLFYFSPTKTFISTIPIITAAIGAISSFLGFFHLSSIQGIDDKVYLMFLSAIGLTFFIYLGFAALSFIDKRALFIYSEDKTRRYGKWRKRWNAFLGKNIEGTIYEKENKLFQSIGFIKESESPVDIFLFLVIILTLLDIL